MMKSQTKARTCHCSPPAIRGKNLYNATGTKTDLYQWSVGLFLQMRVSFHAEQALRVISRQLKLGKGL